MAEVVSVASSTDRDDDDDDDDDDGHLQRILRNVVIALVSESESERR